MNITIFSHRLKNVLWSNEALTLIPGFGWNDGGCRSLMKAFVLWFGADNVRTYQIIKTPEQLHSEHVFIRIGDWFLDGDGVSRFDEMKYRWQFEEGFPTVIIREFDPAIEPIHINGEDPFYIARYQIDNLVRLLDEHFDKRAILQLLHA